MARQPKKSGGRERENSEKTFCNNQFQPFEAKTPNQKRYFSAMQNFTVVIAHGPAGTGKTGCCVAYALQELYFGRIDKVIVTRPAIEAAGEKLGFLPGTLDEKFSEYLVPIKEIGEKVLGKSHYEMFVRSGKIVGIPLAYCRGRTFDNSFVIVDESQNCNGQQMKMILTRMGENSKVFINGDSFQSDQKGENGLDDCIKRLSWHPRVKVIEFENNDIVRNGMISEILESYRRVLT